MMRTFTICFLLLCLTFVSPVLALQREGIAAVVNDDIVSYSDVRYRTLLNLSAMQGNMTPDIQQRVEQQSLDTLINEALQMQEARKLGITVSPQQIREGIEGVAQQNGFNSVVFREQLQAAGIPVSTLESQIEAQIAWSYVVRRKLRPQVNVAESEIDSVVEQNVEQENQPRYRLAEIVLKGKDKAELDNLAQTIMNKLQDGAPFPLLARQFSQAPGADKGGDLGWLTVEQLPEEYKYAVQKMQPGQVTPPLQTNTGYNILLMLDMRKGGESEARIVADSKPMQVTTTKTVVSQDVTLSMKQILIAVAKDEPKAVIAAKMARAKQLGTEISGCDQMAEKSKNFLSAGTGDINDVKLKDFPAGIAKIIGNLPIGQLSIPVQHSKGIAVLMVCDRDVTEVTTKVEVPLEQQNEPVATELSQSQTEVTEVDEIAREKIANRLGMQRLNKLQEHYLRDLRAAAYIENRER